MSGPRSRADEGAVVMLLPELRGKADEKIPIAGMRPSDPEPGDDAKGFVILRQLGGAYARADENGRWEMEVPRRGRYVLLVISKEQRRPRSEGEVRMADLRKLSAYFESGAALIGDRRYELRMEVIRDEQEFAVEFD